MRQVPTAGGGEAGSRYSSHAHTAAQTGGM